MAKNEHSEGDDMEESNTADETEKKDKKKDSKKEPSKEEIFKDYKYQVYQEAVTKVYKEGKISPNEDMVLESMRDTLEIPFKVREQI